MSLRSMIAVGCTILIALFLISCADVPSTAPEFPDFKAQVRFIHAASDLGDVELLVQETVGAGFTSKGTLSFQGSLGYFEIPAGNRQFTLRSGGSDISTEQLAIESDGKITILILPSTPRLKLYKERRTFDALPDTVGQVRFIGAISGDNTYDIVNTADGSVVAENIGFGGSSGYVNLPAGSYTFGMVVHETEDVLATAEAITLANGQRYTVVMLGASDSPALSTFQDD